jgi:hypothetical protein
MPEPTFTLDADSLLSKWGFGDGDALSDWWWDNFDEDAPFNDHDVLHALVLAHLVPAIRNAGHEVEVEFIETIHNPVRADTFDGRQVNHHLSSPWCIEPPVVVQVTRSQIEAVVVVKRGDET